jgi:hypothetical protein
MKACIQCKQELPFDAFYHRTLKSGRLHILAACKQCTIDAVTRYDRKPKNKARQKELHFERRYRLSMKSYKKLLDAQNSVCAICQLPESSLAPSTGKPKMLCVDHDHVTGVVRGLLCSNCNRALGWFGDSLETIRAAVAYLEIRR